MDSKVIINRKLSKGADKTALLLVTVLKARKERQGCTYTSKPNMLCVVLCPQV